VPAVSAAAAACGLLVSYPYAAVGRALLGRFDCEHVGGTYGAEVLQSVCECCA
jgi:hypothetical protein